MLAMDQIRRIRQLYYGQGQNNISEISRHTGLNWKTVSKFVDMTDFNEPDPMPAEQNFCPKLDLFKPLICNWLAEDKKALCKHRYTAKRVFNRLRKEADGFSCSYRFVVEYVKKKKLKCKDGLIPLNHSQGEAQGDLGATDFYENSMRYSGKYFVLDLPYSNGGFLQLYYGENMECLLESMEAIFDHIGGVPTEIWFANTRTIVTKTIRGWGYVRSRNA